jgi:hypothetical protein
MAVDPLTATYENGELWVKRGDRPVIHQPFRPAIGDDPIRPWISEGDAMDYWNSISADFQMSGLTTEEIQELQTAESNTASANT